MDPSILVMLSGGLDSTGMLWKLIKESRSFHVHHMNLFNQENRAKVESVAIKNILKYVGCYSTFGYSESTHYYPTYNNCFMYDSDIVAFISGTICLSMPSIKHIAIGMTKNDTEGPSLTSRIERSTKIISAFTAATKIYPVMNMSKREIYESLPSDLRDLTWSCRTPIYKDNTAISCDKCSTCESLEEMKKEVLYDRHEFD